MWPQQRLISASSRTMPLPRKVPWQSENMQQWNFWNGTPDRLRIAANFLFQAPELKCNRRRW